MTPQYKIGDRVKFAIDRTEPDFDRACDVAAGRAASIFGADEDGYLTNVEGSERQTDSLHIEFVKYACAGGMSGWSYIYEFVTWVEREE